MHHFVICYPMSLRLGRFLCLTPVSGPQCYEDATLLIYLVVGALHILKDHFMQ